ncbi:MAG: DUF721 domain-containing protein [Elusimicrobia bacterium]|nr:DUF721 domain-containing protein [Elusimicrobiota bacterium]
MAAFRKRWATANDLVRSFKFRAGVQSDKISILNAVWERELGHFSRHWSLLGVQRGMLFIKPNSAAAAQELVMRRAEIVRTLNKHFSRAWIKGIKTTSK